VVFSSLEFIFRFLPLFLIIYYIVPKKFQNAVLLTGSLCFYAWGDLKNLVFLLISVFINFIAVKRMKRENCNSKPWLITALLFNIGMLFFFKYINFAIDNINVILAGINGKQIAELTWGLPLGISFYTFQAISYVIDFYRKDIEDDPDLFHFATYLIMFPKLVSGPITSYKEIGNQLKNRNCSVTKFEKGLKLFVIGLGLKVILANRLGILWNNIQTIGFESISTPLAWLGSIGYSLQLYLDFQGYSLMAIGAGQMLGFHLPDNFRHPYMSKSMTEFWRRWHITLGLWFRNYVYIPLGGNRKGKKRLVFNLLIVWLLTGLWHGASWNYVLWGLVLFVLILFEKLYFKKILDRSVIIARIYMLLAIPLTWILFAIHSLKDVLIYYGRMFGIVQGINVNNGDFIKYFSQYKWLLFTGIFLCFPYGKRLFKKLENNILCTIFLLLVFWYSVYLLSNGLNNPFLYFQF